MKKNIFTTLFLLGSYTLVLAQNVSIDSTKAPNPDAPSDSTKSFIIKGNADVYARYGINKTESSTAPSFQQGVGLGWFNVSAEKKWQKVSALLDVVAGARGTQLYQNESDGKFLGYIKQAYVSYRPIEKLAFTLGTMTTHFNYEYTEPFENYVYTNSMIYTIIPAAYTGLKAEYQITDKWQLMLGIYGDSDRKIDRNKGKHFGGQLAYTGDKFSFATNFITGRDGDTTQVFMADIYADYAFSSQFKLGLQYHLMTDKPVATGEKNLWSGTALYAQYKITKQIAMGFRAERLNDADAYWFGEQGTKLWTYTVAGQYRFGNFMIEPEIRYDTANKGIYQNADNSFVKTEPSFILALLYKF